MIQIDPVISPLNRGGYSSDPKELLRRSRKMFLSPGTKLLSSISDLSCDCIVVTIRVMLDSVIIRERLFDDL